MIEEVLFSFNILVLVKILVWVGLAVYWLFGFFMMRQINIMSKAIKISDDYVIKILGAAHFVTVSLVLIIV